MAENIKRSRGRPVVNSTPVTVRLAPELLDWLDAERAKLEPEPTRPEFIRQALERLKG